MSRVAFHTLGCKVNQYETEAMMAQFESAGYDTVGFNEEADVYLVNTCTVTNMADKKSRQMLAKAKKNNPDSLVVAVGCYVQAAQDTLDKVDNVDLLIGNTDKGRVVEVVENYLDAEVIPTVTDLAKYRVYDELWVSLKQGHTRAHIKIQDGCDQFCSYCIIPYARGRIRSREAESIIGEVKELVANGYKEIVLTGIHLASYGKQFENYLLIDLLEDLDKVNGLERIRLGSLEPTLVTVEFTERLGALEHVCDHFHLSMQSGDDTVLKAMNRKYTTEDYMRAVNLLREVYPDAAFTTDLIVGFPGETDVQFDNTNEFLKNVGFYDIHVFKYSMRDGTKAAAMTGQVDGGVKNTRSNKAMSTAETLKSDFLQKRMDKNVHVLIEDIEEIDGVSYETGHTSNYMKVYFDAGNVEKTVSNGVFREGRIYEEFRDGVKAK